MHSKRFPFLKCRKVPVWTLIGQQQPSVGNYFHVSSNAILSPDWMGVGDRYVREPNKPHNQLCYIVMNISIVSDTNNTTVSIFCVVL